MSTYSVQFGVMSEVNEGLQTVYKNLSEIGTDLEQMAASGTVEFQGTTKHEFLIAQQNYERAHAQLAASLQQASTILSSIHEDYTGAEARGTALWNC